MALAKKVVDGLRNGNIVCPFPGKVLSVETRIGGNIGYIRLRTTATLGNIQSLCGSGGGGYSGTSTYTSVAFGRAFLLQFTLVSEGVIDVVWSNYRDHACRVGDTIHPGQVIGGIDTEKARKICGEWFYNLDRVYD